MTDNIKAAVTPPHHSPNRIVITIDNANFSDSTLEYAVNIAARLQRQLHGVFIEDIDLLSSARLPFATEICMHTGQPRHFDHRRLQLSFNNAAARFQEKLALLANQQSVHWTARSVRGRRRDFYSADLNNTDYCIYESGNNHKAAANPSAIKHLLVIDGEDEKFYRTLASLLGPLQQYELHITQIKNDSVEQPASNNNDNVSANNSANNAPPQAANYQQLLPVGVHLQRLPLTQLQRLLSSGAASFDYVIASRQHWPIAMAPLLGRLRCPLILVN